MPSEQEHPDQSSLPSPSGFIERPHYAEAVVCGIAFLAYVLSLTFSFVNDDRFQVIANPFIRSWADVPHYFVHHVWAGLDVAVVPNYYRPFFYLLFRVEYAIFGLNPLGWHLVNVAIHVLATWLVFVFARRLLGSRAAAFVSALLFAVYPVHVESVAWVSGVTDPLLTVLLLACVIAFIRWYSGDGRQWYIWSLIFAACALLTKETAAVLTLLVAAAAYTGYKQQRLSARKALLGTLPYAGLTLVYLAVRQTVLHGFSHTASNLTVMQMVLTWPKILAFYLRQLVVPFFISPYYDMTPVNSAASLAFFGPLLALAGVVAVCGWAFWKSEQRGVLLQGLLWILLPLLPVLDVLVFDPGELVHDRYLYASTVGSCLLAAMLLVKLSGRLQNLWPAQRLQVAGAIIISVLFLAVTLPNESYYRNDVALFTHAVELAPGSDVAVVNLGTVLMENDQPGRGMAMFQTVVDRNPNNAIARFNLGRVEYGIEQYALAEALVGRAIVLDRRHPNWWLLYAGIEAKLGKYAQAEESVRRALAINPSGLNYHVALGAILLAKGDREGAAAEFRKELELHPGDPGALRGLAELQSH